MSTEIDVNIKVKGAKKAADEVAGVGEAAKETNEAAAGMSGALDRMTGGMITAFKGIKDGLKAAGTGFKSLKAAMVSTGIGALVVAVGSLVAYFTKTQRGAEMLETATAALGVAFGVIVDKVSAFGEALINAFKNPKQAIMDFYATLKQYVMDQVQKLIDGFGLLGDAIGHVFAGEFAKAKDAAIEGAKKIGDAAIHLNPLTAGVALLVEEVVEMAPAITRAAKAAAQLAKDSIDLRKAQRDLAVAFARGRAEIQEYNLVAEDSTKPLEERMEAAKKAVEMEQSLLNRRVALAAEEVRIQEANMKLTEATEADYERLTQLEVELLNVREESAGKQTELQNKLNAMRAEAAAIAIEAALAEQEALDAQYERMDALAEGVMSAHEREIAAVVKKYETLFALADEFGHGEAELLEKQKQELAAIEEEYRKKSVKDEAKSEDDKVAKRIATMNTYMAMAQSFASFLQVLNDKSDSDDIEAQRKAFQRAKGIQTAAAVMSTAQAVIAALAAPPVGLGYPAGIPGAITAAITGATQIATIAKQKFPDSGAGSTGSITPPTMTQAMVPNSFAQSATAPMPNVLTEPTPIKAYVVSNEVTTQQQIDAQLAHRSILQ